MIMSILDVLRKKKVEILSPVDGELINITDVNDSAWAQGMFGPGIAIKPTEGIIKAPADGEIVVAFPTGHAFTMRTDEGVELLIHIGLNTVELCGECFEKRVSSGDRVTKGQTVATFDIEEILRRGYDTTVPMVVMNPNEFAGVEIAEPGQVLCGDNVMIVVY